MATQWTIRRMACWIWGGYLVLSVLRGLWMALVLLIGVGAVLGGDLLQVPFDSDARRDWVVVWVILLGILAFLAMPAVCLGFGRRHLLQDPLRGAVWAARGYHFVMLMMIGCQTLLTIGNYTKLQEQWGMEMLIWPIVVTTMTAVVWYILVVLTKPLTLPVFRTLAQSLDSMQNQAGERIRKIDLIRWLATNQLTVGYDPETKQYRGIHPATSRQPDLPST